MRKRIAALVALMIAAVLLLTGCSEVLQTVAEIRPEITEVLPLATDAQEKEQTETLTGAPTDKPTEKAAGKATKKPAKATEKPTKKPTKEPTAAPTETPAGPIIEPQAIADYIFAYGRLPDNFITKAEAQALGWDSSYNYVSDVAPGKSIGGDRFGNYEGQLPKKKGRTFKECDCNYTKGKRGGERIVYSNDGHVWYTNDHYETFTELFPSK